MLIRCAEINVGEVVDVRISDGRIAAIKKDLSAHTDETVIEADGAALLPGLNDHHIHLFALAASQASLPCGPPQVNTADQLAERLQALDKNLQAGEWIRGIGYHDSVAGEMDRDWLDAQISSRPVRIQHRSGRLWILNSCALEQVQTAASDPLERVGNRCTGRLYDADAWLRSRLGGQRPSLHRLSRQLASYGVTGLTDTTPNNGPEAYRHFSELHRRGELLQNLQVMGDASLDSVASGGVVWRGAHKFHLHETELPDLDVLCAAIRRSHVAERAVAFHCVTRTELVFALAALEQAGVRKGDRIEHAAVTPPELLLRIAEMGLAVVTQPHFISERGDHYLREVAADDQPWLYRLRGFLDAGVPLAGSTDAPFGDPNPWKAMHAATTRCSNSGQRIGAGEALTAEQALGLFLSPLPDPGAAATHIKIGIPADLCLLAEPWPLARLNLAAVKPALTIVSGNVIKT